MSADALLRELRAYAPAVRLTADERGVTVRWCRRYRSCDSDERCVEAPTLVEALGKALAWERENDRRKPQHAEGR